MSKRRRERKRITEEHETKDQPDELDEESDDERDQWYTGLLQLQYQDCRERRPEKTAREEKDQEVENQGVGLQQFSRRRWKGERRD